MKFRVLLIAPELNPVGQWLEDKDKLTDWLEDAKFIETVAEMTEVVRDAFGALEQAGVKKFLALVFCADGTEFILRKENLPPINAEGRN